MTLLENVLGTTLCSPRRGRTATALLLAVAATTLATPASAAGSVPQDGPHDGPRSTYLLTAVPGQLDELADDLPRDGVRVVRELDGIGMAVVEATDRAAAGLGRDRRVAAVTPDSEVALQAGTYAPYDPKADVSSMYNIAHTVGARDPQWARYTGKGIDIAVLDSGITPVEGLATQGKIVNGPDLSFDSQDPGTRYLDGFGHGTHMAGIIAGKDSVAGPTSKRPDTSGSFHGVAPDARLVNVKVADALGNADVSQIIAGIDWVVQHRTSDGLNIRVLNLSLGTPSRQSYLTDPLAYAAEQAWHRGIVVVAAAGNDGTGTGKLLNPAQDPYILAVGANDTRGTKITDDDVIPDFSTRGDGIRNPDVVAHGVSVQSLRVPGSFIDESFSETAAIDERFIRGSGTSQAAAVASGTVALLLERNPGWTPDAVKGYLKAGARPLPSANHQAQGKGMLDLRRAGNLKKFTSGPQEFARATGIGSLDAARGGYRVVTEAGVELSGERDVFGKPYASGVQAALSATDGTWTGGTWNTTEWTGTAMTDAGWATTTWTGTDWSGSPWTARTWAGGTWTARTWADGYWEARTWADGYWEARTWAARTWAARTWASADWR
jgi:serine protease AprX